MAFSRKALYGGSNATQFIQELKAAASLSNDNFRGQHLDFQMKRLAVEAHKSVIMEVFRKLVKRTPIDDGPVKTYALAKNSWRITLTNVGYGPRKDPSKSVISEATASLSRLKIFQNVYIVNTAPYINILEYGGYVPRNPGPASDRWGHLGETRVSAGFSTQAPRGIIRISLEEMRKINTLKTKNFGYKGIR